MEKRIRGRGRAGNPEGPDCQGEPSGDLKRQIKDLEAERNRLRIESSMLRKANELLKKEMGADYSLLSNREKALVVGALEGGIPHSEDAEGDRTEEIYLFLRKKGHQNRQIRGPKAADEGDFHRQLPLLRLQEDEAARRGAHRKAPCREGCHEDHARGATQRLQAQAKEILIVHGGISPLAENVIKRDFKAGKPFQNALTDITDFSLGDGKVYLSPMIDCFTGCPINWTIGKSPNSLLTTDMLDKTYELAGDSGMVVHSDRGFHYRYRPGRTGWRNTAT